MTKLKMKKNRLTTKIPMQIIGLISFIMILICIVLSVILYNVMSETIRSEINYITRANANEVQAYLDKMQTLSNKLSSEVNRFKSLQNDVAEEMIINSLHDTLKDDNIFSAYYAFEPNKYFENTHNGISYYAFRDGDKIKLDKLNDYDVYSTGDYYATTKNIMSTHITEPYSYVLSTGETVWLITISNPIIDEKGEFLGVANCDILTDAISNLSYDLGNYKTAYSYILTNSGTYIAHTADEKLIGSVYASTDETEKIILDSVKNGKDIIKEGSNSIYGGDALMFQYPINIKGIDSSWSSGFVVSQNEITSSVKFIVVVVGVIALIGLIILAVFSFLILKKSLKPIDNVMQLADRMRLGILSSNEEIEIKTNDELGELSNVIKDTVHTLNSYISDISFVLDNISSGNLRINVDKEYIGDFKSIRTSLNKITDSLNETFNEIQVTANEVALGSDQVASASQQLSQGATEQASTIEEFAATIQEISERIQNSAKNALEANNKATYLGQELSKGNQQMQQMVNAMSTINKKSNEIGKIIKTIEDIAFQTNILALNAAVEAARAGTAGKGFAVVADEVRNLARKSSEAAKNTTDLIEDTIKAVNDGTVVVDNTANTLLDVIKETGNIIEIIDNISIETKEQAISIEQAAQGMDQISSVIQTNSASAEESAASSEELSSQAEAMKNLVKKFQLKDL